jgi:GntR family transcriptional regulator
LLVFNYTNFWIAFRKIKGLNFSAMDVFENTMVIHPPATPLFVQVAETIKARISGHQYHPGGSLPSARELEAQFQVSNITIRRALERLSREGLIVSKRGKRARVAERNSDIVEIETSGDFRVWVDAATGRRLGMTAEVIDRKVVAGPKPIGRILGLDQHETVERIRRVRKLISEPISYYISYGPSRLLTQIPSREIETSTFIEAYQAVCDIKLTAMEQRLRATVADMDLAAILNVTYGAPLFAAQNIYYSNRDRAMAVTQMFYRSDHYVYTIKRRI